MSVWCACVTLRERLECEGRVCGVCVCVCVGVWVCGVCVCVCVCVCVWGGGGVGGGVCVCDHCPHVGGGRCVCVHGGEGGRELCKASQRRIAIIMVFELRLLISFFLFFF